MDYNDRGEGDDRRLTGGRRTKGRGRQQAADGRRSTDRRATVDSEAAYQNECTDEYLFLLKPQREFNESKPKIRRVERRPTKSDGRRWTADDDRQRRRSTVDGRRGRRADDDGRRPTTTTIARVSRNLFYRNLRENYNESTKGLR